MIFSHCNHDEKLLTLHDCVAESAYLESGKLVFEFPDGFWISPDHPESSLSNYVKTDFSKMEYTPADGKDCDVSIFVFQKTFFKKTVRVEWTLQELLHKINNGKCKLEFLYQYVGGDSRVVECQLIFDKKPYWKECEIKMSVSEACYYWNNLRSDRVW